ncbi:MAG: 50S ribosomal protein L21 [Solirubrobacteraceae bacterium]
MYAIVKTGGKQYRVSQGESLLVERLAVEPDATIDLPTLLYVNGADVIDGDGLADVTVQARVVGHERGPKLRIVKFKPKRGYKRRNGHRQELTRIEVTSMGPSSASASSSQAAPVRAEAPAVVAATPAPAPAPVAAPAAEVAPAPEAAAAPSPTPTEEA